VGLAVGIEAVGLDHQRAGADQQVAEAGACGDAGVAVVGRVGLGQVAGVLGLAVQEHPLVRHEHAVEMDHAGGLPVTPGERRTGLAGAAGRARGDGDALGVDRHGAGDRERPVLGRHRAAGHHQEAVHVGCAGDDRLDPRDHDAVGALLDDVHVGVGIGLQVGAQRTVALGVGHGDGVGQVLRLEVGQEREEAGVVVAAGVVVDAPRRLVETVEGVVHQVAQRAPRFATDQPHRLELGQ
jgi:hypothetical protein